MAVTYTPIGTNTLSSNTTELTFGSLSGYTDLVVVCNYSTELNATYGCYLVFNATYSGYGTTRITGDGTNYPSGRQSSSAAIRFQMPNLTKNNFSNTAIINISNYSNTSYSKSALIQTGAPGGGTQLVVGTWFNTAAITSLSIGGDGGQYFAAGSTFTVYGILGA